MAPAVIRCRRALDAAQGEHLPGEARRAQRLAAGQQVAQVVVEEHHRRVGQAAEHATVEVLVVAQRVLGPLTLRSRSFQ